MTRYLFDKCSSNQTPRKTPGTGYFMIQVRQSLDRLIFIMEIPMPVRCFIFKRSPSDAYLCHLFGSFGLFIVHWIHRKQTWGKDESKHLTFYKNLTFQNIDDEMSSEKCLRFYSGLNSIINIIPTLFLSRFSLDPVPHLRHWTVPQPVRGVMFWRIFSLASANTGQRWATKF